MLVKFYAWQIAITKTKIRYFWWEDLTIPLRTTFLYNTSDDSFGNVIITSVSLHHCFKKIFLKAAGCRCFTQYAQPTRNIPGIFAECSLSVAMFETSRKHLENTLKEKVFWKVLDGKVVFGSKVYNLIIKNDDLLVNFSNHEVMFPEYLRNILRMSVSKIFQGYFWNIVKL